MGGEIGRVDKNRGTEEDKKRGAPKEIKKRGTEVSL